MLESACKILHKDTDLTRTQLVREERDRAMPPLDILFRQVPEGYEFVGVLLTILGSLGIMVVLGAWWSR